MKLIHNYLLERQLCENELVRVFRVRDRESQKIFTLSLINDEYEIDPDFLMRMISDRSKSQVTHPHVARIIDFGEIKRQQYFVSDYIGNKTLSSFLGRPVPVTFALDVISQLASGLHFLSLQGSVLGNIDPDNIFFDPYGNATLSALELIPKPISKQGIEQKRRISRYQSPELIAGNEVDERTDLYSLGVLLFELLTSERFSDRNYIDDTDVENVNELIPYLPEDNFGFQPVINKLLAKNPKQRYRNGLELVDALNEYDSRLSDVSEGEFSLEFEEEEDEEEVDFSAFESIFTDADDITEFNVELNSEPETNAGLGTDELNMDESSTNVTSSEVVKGKSKLKIPDLKIDSSLHLSDDKLQAGGMAKHKTRTRARFFKKSSGFSPDSNSGLNSGSNSGLGPSPGFTYNPDLNSESNFASNLESSQKYVFAGGGFAIILMVFLIFLIPENKIPDNVLPANGGNIALSKALLDKPKAAVNNEKLLTHELSSNEYLNDNLALQNIEQMQLDIIESSIFVDSDNKRLLPPLITQEDVYIAKQTAIQLSDKIDTFLVKAQGYLSQFKFTTPKNENAYAMYVAIQNIDPENKQAREGIIDIAEGYAYMANRQINKQNYEKATYYIEKGLTIQSDNEWLITLQSKVNDWRNVDGKTEPLGTGAEAVAFDGIFE